MHAILILGLLAAGQTSPHRKKSVLDFSDVTIEGELIRPDGSYLSARAGGAQDVDFFRDRALAGEVPRPEGITPEGLLAGHDLPLSAPPACSVLLCPAAEATRVRLVSRPEVSHLVQVGFTSGMVRLERAPRNLILLVDRSGSMAGQKLELVTEALRAIADRSTRVDQLSIVTFSDRAELLLSPTRDRAAIREAIARIESGGSTALEAGLESAFELAAATRSFDGTTRVMLFTDEQPNVGRTDAAGFRAQAEVAAKLGIGLTIIGVGVDFGVELATAVSSVRGGNLFYFPDPFAMKKRIAEELDLMTTELGRDLELAIAPRSGMRITGVYGVPDGILAREGDAIVVRVRTLFASKRRGAIYLALAPNDLSEEENGPLATLDLSFVEAGGIPRRHRLSVESKRETLGLARGAALIDAYVGLHTAAERVHHLSDPKGALAALEPVAKLFQTETDPDLIEERRLILALRQTLSSRTGEIEETLHGARDVRSESLAVE